MRKFGAYLLFVWWTLNAIPGVGSLIHIATGKHAPGLQMNYTPDEIAHLENRVLNTVDGIAVIANKLIVVVCFFGVLVTFRVWKSRNRKLFFALASGVLAIQVAAMWSDRYFSYQNWPIVLISSILFSIGLFGLGRNLGSETL